MALVEFTTNELVATDEALGLRVEQEIREAAETLEPLSGVLQCRILVERGIEPGTSRVRIQFERPGWVKSFGLSMGSPVEDLRRATEVVLTGRRPADGGPPDAD